MAAEKVTPMVLKVDLQCPCCYKKIKKTLCKFPQIRDQIFDEKTNTVCITVVCCSPERIRDKLCYKGGKVIKSIEIKGGKPPKEAEKGGDKPKEAEKKKEGGDKPKEAEKKKDGGDKPKGAEKPKIVVIEKPKEEEKAKVAVIDKPKEAAPPAAKPKSDAAAPPKNPQQQLPPPAAVEVAKAVEPVPAHGVPSVFPYVGPTYDGYGAGPYYHGYGFPPQPCYEVYHGYGHGSGPGYGSGYGYVRGGHVNNRCDGYFSEENPQSCAIM